MKQPNVNLFKEQSKRFSLIRLRGKVPCESQWEQYSSKKRNFDQIQFAPGENAGIACGPASNVIAKDVDHLDLFESVCRRYRWEIPQTRIHLTGRGLPHFLYAYPNNGREYGNKSLKVLGFDIRGRGGQIVAPGSIHPDTGEPYTIYQDVEPAPPPQWFLDLYKADRPQWSTILVDSKTGLIKHGKVSEETAKLIRDGVEEGFRSDAMWKVIHTLVKAGFSDDQLFWVFYTFQIGEKFRAIHRNRDEWLNKQIKKARTTSKPTADETEQAEFEWEEPTDLTKSIPPALAFPLDCLPCRAANYARDESERMQSPVDLIAVPMLITLAGLIGKNAAIRPKAKDDWEERPCLWGAAIASVSSMKSQNLAKATSSLRRIQAQLSKEYAETLQKVIDLKKDADIRGKVWKKECERLLKSDPDATLPPKPELPPAPTPRRILTNDATIEKLAALMVDSRGLSLFRDELAGFLLNMSRYNSGSDRQFYLECYSGGSYSVDRIGRGEQFIKDLYLNIFGGIQPQVARKIFSIESGTVDGFFDRFGLLCYPDTIPHYDHVDRWPNTEMRCFFNEICDRLASADWEDILIVEDDQGKPYARFDGSAQVVFDQWLMNHMKKIKSLKDYDPLSGMMGKARGLVVRMVLVIHLASWAAGETSDPKTIQLRSLERALKLLEEYLMPMWKRVFAAFGKTAADDGAVRIAKWIKEEKLAEVKVRDVRRKHWSGLLEDREIQSALDMLVAHRWLGPVQIASRTGRPSIYYQVNPLVYGRRE